jgi:uncharacterized protein YcbK (DUF882 family)
MRILPASRNRINARSGHTSTERVYQLDSSDCDDSTLQAQRLVKSARLRRRPAPDGSRRITLVVSVVMAIGYLAFLRPAEGLDARTVRLSSLAARPAADAFGRSGQLKMRFALPGLPVDYPIEVQGGLDEVQYSWVARGDSVPTGQPRRLASGLVAPDAPGFYNLQLTLNGERRVVEDPPLAVLVPRSEKKGSVLNGYQMGFYRGDRPRRSDPEAPIGFVRIDSADLELRVSAHLRLSDFVTRDRQSTWPRYAAVDPRLLDKLELVLAEISSWTGNPEREPLEVDVHSSFRTPLHNRLVRSAARDSRHQLGDAIDVAVDANRDGRVNSKDQKLLTMAVDIVERTHPDLVGGMGIYARNNPFVHIDARGVKVRWRG